MAMGKYKLQTLKLIASGALVLVTLTILSIAYLTYETEYLTSAVQKESNRATFLTSLSDFYSALDFETRVRCTVTASTAEVDQAQKSVNKTVQPLLKALHPPNRPGAFVLSDYRRVAQGSVEIYVSHVNVIAAYSAAVYKQLLPSTSPPLRNAMYFYTALLLHWKQCVMAVVLGSIQQGGLPAVNPAVFLELSRATIAAAQLSMYIDPSMTWPDAASRTLRESFHFISVNATIPVGGGISSGNSSLLSTLRNLREFSQYLQTIHSSIPKQSETARSFVIVFSFLTVISFVCLLMSIAVVVLHVHTSRAAEDLLGSFGDKDFSRALSAKYKSSFISLRTDILPPTPNTEVEAMFYGAANFLMKLRPFISQALFGELNRKQNSDQIKDWNVNAQPLRLDIGVSQCQVSVLIISVSSNEIRNSSMDTVADVMSQVSTALLLITNEANIRGGVVCEMALGVRISCIWGLHFSSDDNARMALSAARAIVRCLTEVDLCCTVNIASGTCCLSNTKIGKKKFVAFVGGAFDMNEKFLLLNEIHTAKVIVDEDTYKLLPSEIQRKCRPIVVLKQNDVPLVAYSAADDVELQGTHWKQYNSAFALYQSGMTKEALTEFRKYLILYPNDHCALWLVKNVLEVRHEQAQAATRGLHTS